jgi:hypothetical protein
MTINAALWFAAWTTVLVQMNGTCSEILVSPVDAGTSPVPILSASEVSTVAVPVTIQLDEVAEIVNRLAPETVADTHHVHAKVKPAVVFHGVNTHVELQDVEVAHIDYEISRGAIGLTTAGDRLAFRSRLTGHARGVPGRVKGSFAGTASGTATLTVSPDFNLNPAIIVGVEVDRADIGFEPTRVFNHEVGISLPIRRLAQEQANKAVDRIRGRICADVSKAANLRAIAERAWKDMPRCIRVPSTENIWLRINPTGVALDGPHAEAGAITAILQMQAIIETFVQHDRPEAPRVSALPSLSSRRSDGHFHLILPVAIRVGELNGILSSCLLGADRGEIRIGEGCAVTLKAPSLFASGHSVYLKVSFSGEMGPGMPEIQGTITCSTVPHLAVETQVLTFDQFDFTTETRSALASTAAWLLKPVVLRELQRRLKVDLSRPLEAAAEQANHLVGHLTLEEPFHLAFELDRIVVEQLAIQEDSIRVNFDVSGSARLSYGTYGTSLGLAPCEAGAAFEAWDPKQ